MSKLKTMTLAEAIDRIYKDSNMTIRDFAEKLGISHPHLWNMRHNRTNPSIEMLLKIKEITGYDPYILAAVANGEVESSFYQMLLDAYQKPARKKKK